MIPDELAQRLGEMGQDPDLIYSTRTRKAGPEGTEPVPWMDRFYFLDDAQAKPEFVMDAASFVPVIALDPKPEDRVMDMAAAPGMKTVLMSMLMGNRGSITACDVDRKRILRLRSNIRKFNCRICETIRCDASRYKIKSEGEKFDKVLLDAPCGGEGMVMKQKKLFSVWSMRRIARLQKVQKKMITRGFGLLREGGTLVYSTCTFAPEENEEVVEWLAENSGAKIEKIEIGGLIRSAGIMEWRGKKFPNHEKFIRIWPYQNNTNGMFVSRIKKV